MSNKPTKFVFNQKGKLLINLNTVNGGSNTAIRYTYRDIHRIGDFELTSTVPKRVSIDNGYIDLDDNNTYAYNYYIHDNQGSVRVVIGENGAIKQATDYSAYGVPSTRFTNITNNNHLHLGLEWQAMKGLYGYYNNARFRDALLAGMFYQQDPLAEKYYPYTPYHYGVGNPLLNIDFNGMDIWDVDPNGYVTFYQKTDIDIDQINMVDKNGVKLLDEAGNPMSIAFEYGTIESHTVKKWGDNHQSDYWQVRGDNNARALFDFFSENITANNDLEFSLTQTGMSGEKGLNFVSTSHELGAERSFYQLYMDKLQFGYTYRGHIHSHPASPFPGNSDLKIKNTIINTQLRNQKIEPFFSIYYVNKNDKQNLFNIYVPF